MKQVKKQFFALLLVIATCLSLAQGQALASETGESPAELEVVEEESEAERTVAEKTVEDWQEEAVPATTGSDYEYEDITGGGVAITRYNGNAKEVSIPSKLGGYTVTSVGEDAFSGCADLISVTIPNSVTSIGEDAFSGCSALESITIPDSVTTIGPRAFSECASLASVTLSNKLTSLGTCAFYNCDQLTTIKIPKSLTVCEYGWFDGGAFEDCDSLKTVTIASGAKTIAADLFRGCTGLESIVIPDTVNTIEENAFMDCVNLKTVKIGSAVTSIGEDAFSGCSALESITIPNSVTTIGPRAFSECASLTSVTLSNKLTSLGTCAFYNCDQLTTIKIPKSLTVCEYGWFDGGAFEDCDSLKTVTIASGAKTIAADLFRGCTGLESIVIPDTVNTIEENAFKDCVNLKTVKIGSAVTSIGEDAFSGCSTLESITIPDSVTTIGPRAFNECASLASVTLSNNLTSLGTCAFYNCDQLTTIKIPKSLTACEYGWLDGGAFEDCDSLKTVTIASGAKTIAADLFRDCTGLESIVIPNTVNTIEENAFKDCVNLKTVKIGSAVTSIGENAFSGCSALTTITIPSSVVTIGARAFVDCTALTSATVSYSVTEIGEYALGVYYNVNGDFVPVNNFVLSGYAGTAAETYAKESKLKFNALLFSTPKLSSVTNSATGVTVKWKTSKGAAKYRIYRKTASTGWKRIGESTSTSYTDTSAKSGTTYYYTVRCITADGKSTTSGYDTTGKSIKYIAAPKLSSISNGAKGVTVKWSASKGAVKYRVYRKTGSGSWKKLADTTSTSYTDKTAKAGTTYSYTVRCITADGKSATSGYDTTGKTIKRLTQPTPSVSKTSNGIKTSWSKVTGASKYYVYRKTASGSWSKIATTTSTSYTDKTAKKGTTYYYTVKAVSGSYLSSYTSSKAVKR